jgi:hypothetical protein
MRVYQRKVVLMNLVIPKVVIMGRSKLEQLTDSSDVQSKYVLETLVLCISSPDQQSTFLKSINDACLRASLTLKHCTYRDYPKALLLFANFLALQTDIMSNDTGLV